MQNVECYALLGNVTPPDLIEPAIWAAAVATGIDLEHNCSTTCLPHVFLDIPSRMVRIQGSKRTIVNHRYNNHAYGMLTGVVSFFLYMIDNPHARIRT